MPIESFALTAVSWPVLQEAPGRGQEVPEGVRHGESGHVVHSLPLEEGLPALPGLNHGPSRWPGDTGRWVPSPQQKPKSYRVDTGSLGSIG